jgi:acyl dehydratase
MLQIDRPADMTAYVGKTIGTSDWLVVDQKMIDAFADATGDHQWIHIDIERAKQAGPTPHRDEKTCMHLGSSAWGAAA